MAIDPAIRSSADHSLAGLGHVLAKAEKASNTGQLRLAHSHVERGSNPYSSVYTRRCSWITTRYRLAAVQSCHTACVRVPVSRPTGLVPIR